MRRIHEWTIHREWARFREANRQWGIPGQATAGGPTSPRTEAVRPLELRGGVAAAERLPTRQEGVHTNIDCMPARAGHRSKHVNSVKSRLWG